MPWTYPAFALFATAYLAGFFPPSMSSASVVVAVGLATTLAFTYYALFCDLPAAIDLHRWVAWMRASEWRRALQDLPLWPTTLVLSIPVALAAASALASVGTID